MYNYNYNICNVIDYNIIILLIYVMFSPEIALKKKISKFSVAYSEDTIKKILFTYNYSTKINESLIFNEIYDI